LKIILLTTMGLVSGVFAQDGFQIAGANVRVMRHPDGSKTQLTRSPDNKTITKIKKNSNGVLTMRTIYRMDADGNARSCKIYDGQGSELFKVSYGYRRSDGQLVEERMFDSRSPRIDPHHPDKEMPVQIVQYTYDPQGNRSAPNVINMLPGKTFQEIFGEKSTILGTNPFKDEVPGRANPNARPLKK
jgi:hypothetical protein